MIGYKAFKGIKRVKVIYIFPPTMLTAPSLALNVLTWPTLGSSTPPPLLPAPRPPADCLSPLQPLETAAPNVNVVKSKSNYANAR